MLPRRARGCLAAALLLSTAAAAAAAATPTITLAPHKTSGQYDILVDGRVWLPAADVPVALHGHDDLKPQAEAPSAASAGREGTFAAATTTTYVSARTGVRIVTSAVVFPEIASIVFTQSFPDGATGTATGDRDGVLSSFPAFHVDNLPAAASSGDAPRRGYLQFAGDMVGSGFHVGEWSNKSTGVASGIAGTGPLCVFSEDNSVAAVLSPYENAMAASQVFDKDSRALVYGVMGNVTSIPKGYQISTLVTFAPGGVNNAMMAWGDAMLARTGKKRLAAWDKDFTLQYLGYSTDNGAYYYYLTEEGKNVSSSYSCVTACAY